MTGVRAGRQVTGGHDELRVKIRAIPGSAVPARSPRLPYSQFSELLALYHQQTKNLLVSYSPKKLGFF
ncbi:hypothetical protein ACWEQC_40795 [Streptomyces shenzhenensis]